MSELSTPARINWLTPRNWPDEAAPLSFMDRLWNRFDGAYPHKFRSAFANERAIQNWRTEWADAFTDAGLTAGEVIAASKQCRREYPDWPPTIGQMIALCRPQRDYQAAHEEAAEQMTRRERNQDNWSDPALFWAAAELGADLLERRYETIKNRWQRELDRCAALVAQGQLPREIPRRMRALPAPDKIAPLPAEIAAIAEKARAALRANG